MINHNGEKYLAESMEAAVGRSGEAREVVLVDVASEDGSVAYVRRHFPTVRVVQLSENRGPAAGRNAGLEAAGTDLVLLIDNDVRLADRCVTRLMEALRTHAEAAVAMPSVLYAHDPQRIQYDGADAHFLGLQTLHGENRPVATQDAQVRRIGSVVSACILVDRSRLPAGEPFDESFFIYFEDHDLAVRVRALGWEVLAVPGAHCFHGPGTEGLSIRALGRYSSMRVLCLIRNRWQFILKVYSLRTLVLLLPVLALYEMAQAVVVLRKGWTREWRRAAWWILTHRREILAKRSLVQGSRKVCDRDLLNGGAIPFREEVATTRIERGGRRLLDEMTGLYWRCVSPIL